MPTPQKTHKDHPDKQQLQMLLPHEHSMCSRKEKKKEHRNHFTKHSKFTRISPRQGLEKIMFPTIAIHNTKKSIPSTCLHFLHF